MKLKIIPYYTGIKTLKKALKDKKSKDILWLEILFNDDVDWEETLSSSELKKSYLKACIWYGKFKTMIDYHVKRKPLIIQKGIIDNKEYRRFLEALSFVSTKS